MSDQAPNPKIHIPYTILSLDNVTELAAGNRFEDVVQVHFQGPGSYVDSVKIPKDRYNAAEVDRRIEDILEHHEAVMSLGDQPHPDNLAPGL